MQVMQVMQFIPCHASYNSHKIHASCNDGYYHTIHSIHEEVDSLNKELPTPTEASMASIKCHLEAAKECQARAQDTYRSIVAELSGISNPDKQGEARNKNDKIIKTFDRRAAQVKKDINSYMEKHKSPKNKFSIPLE